MAEEDTTGVAGACVRKQTAKLAEAAGPKQVPGMNDREVNTGQLLTSGHDRPDWPVPQLRPRGL